MSHRHEGPLARVRRVAAAATAIAVLSLYGPPALATPTAVLSGTVHSPAQTAAEGFSVVFHDAGDGREYISPKTDAQGAYRLEVPAGTRYKLVSVIAPDRTALAVQSVPPFSVKPETTQRIDVKFSSAAPLAPGASSDDDGGSGGGWWKVGSIVGIVIGAGLVVGTALSLDSEDPAPASPSAPDPD